MLAYNTVDEDKDANTAGTRYGNKRSVRKNLSRTLFTTVMQQLGGSEFSNKRPVLDSFFSSS